MTRKSVLSLALAAAVAAASVGTPSVATAGEVDGLWASELMPGAFVLVRENEGLLLATVVEIDPNQLPAIKPGIWYMVFGPMTGNTTTLTTLVSETTATASVTFTSATSGTVEITECTPAELCEFPIGVEIPIVKIF